MTTTTSLIAAAPASAATPADFRQDRLYALLPAILRMRDAERGYPLKALLQVIAEQVNVVEDDISQLYENWFIETAADWAVPYIGDLVGYQPIAEAGLPPPLGRERCAPRVLVPRREVANLIGSRRRKGTLSLLEDLARDVAGWPGRPVEMYRGLARAQNIDHLTLDRPGVAALRRPGPLELAGSPFDRLPHTVDVRRIDSGRTAGRWNIPSVGVFVWRLRSYGVTKMPAHCAEEAGPHCFTFSVLGQDAPLYARPAPEPSPAHITGELNLPVPIRRRAFEDCPGAFYGAGPNASVTIWADGWAGSTSDAPVPVDTLIAADLSGWRYAPQTGRIAIDPVLGRLAFPRGQLPRKGVRVSYCYGFSADVGGGEYPRPLIEAAGTVTLYRVGGKGALASIGEALAAWRKDAPAAAVIELATSGVYVEPLDIALGPGQSLQLRAADRARAVIRLIDWQTDLPDALKVSMAPGSRLTLDGLMVTGRPVQVTGVAGDDGTRGDTCASELVIRHCTLVPGWGINCDCTPDRPAEPSLEITNLRARVRIEHSIVGAIDVQEDEVRTDPIPLSICDSVVDAAGDERRALGAPASGIAHAVLTVRRCTVFGIVEVHAIELAENSIFDACVNVARRQLGCMRYCYVSPRCRTPRRHRCQPDGVIAAARAGVSDPTRQAADIARESARVQPRFGSVRYGRPDYAQLALDCAPEIVRGADDESEMGVLHDLYQPQRAANLAARLEEYTPAGMDVAALIVS